MIGNATHSCIPTSEDQKIPPVSESRVRWLLDNVVKHGFFVVGVVAVLTAGRLISPYFLTTSNLSSIVLTFAVLAVVAIGQFLVVVTAGIDLSVGSVAAMAGVILASLLRVGIPMPAAVIAALAAGAAVGIVNGCLVVFAGITPFIATLGMASVTLGTAYLIQNGDLIVIKDDHFINLFAGDLGWAHSEVIIFIIVALLFAAVMRWTVFGRRLYAVGGNLQAAKLSGLPVDRDRVMAYALSGLLSGLGGLMLSAELQEGNTLLVSSLALNSIAAVVVGGSSLSGGRSSPLAAVAGGLLIGTVANILDLISLPVQGQNLVQGVLILVAVYFTSGTGSAVRDLLVSRTRRHPPVRLTPEAPALSPLPKQTICEKEHGECSALMERPQL
jgi:ribose transport system permease protein